MTKLLSVVIAIGAIVGGVGGVLDGERWLYYGGLLIGAAVIALYALGILRNPFAVARAEVDAEATSEGYTGDKPLQPPALEPHRQEQHPPKKTVTKSN